MTKSSRIEVFSLIQQLTDKVKLEYSRLKHGDPKLVLRYSKLLAELIAKNNLAGEKTVLVVSIKSPYSNSYKNNCALLGENISQISGLPLLYVFYEYKYNESKFYDNQAQAKRKAYVSKLMPKDQKRFKDSNFIIIDDAIVTGKATKAVVESISSIAKKITVISVLDLRNDESVVERHLNEHIFSNLGIAEILKLLSTKGYIPTTQMLRTISSLDSKSFKDLIEKIENPLLLKKALREYCS